MTMEQPLTDLASKRGGASLLLRGLLVLSLIIVATLFARRTFASHHRCQRANPLGARRGLPVRSGTRLGPRAKRRRATNERQSYDFGETQQSWVARARAERHCADRFFFWATRSPMATMPRRTNGSAIFCRKLCHSMGWSMPAFP